MLTPSEPGVAGSSAGVGDGGSSAVVELVVLRDGSSVAIRLLADVEVAIQAGMNRLAARRRFPVVG
jgi:hypothetical protein